MISDKISRSLANNKNTILPAIIVLVSFWAFLSILMQRYQNIDFGIFAYGGMALNKGCRLYEDFWDNKSPAIYWLNSVPLYLFGNKIISIRIMEFAFLGASMICLYCGIREYGFSCTVSFSSVIFFLALFFTPTFFEGGNMTEEYGTHFLIFSFYSISLLNRKLTLKNTYAVIFLSGVFFAKSFLLKEPFLINAPAYILMLYLLSKDKNSFLKNFGLFLSGSLFMVLAIVSVNYNAIWGWLDVIDYNFFYSSRGFPLLSKITNGIKMYFFWYLPHNLIFPFMILCALIACFHGKHPLIPAKNDRKRVLFFFAASIYVTAFISIIICGRFFGHYFLMITFPSTLVLTILFDLLIKSFQVKAFFYSSALILFIYALFFEWSGMRHRKIDVLMKLSSLPGMFFRLANPSSVRFTYPSENRGILIVDFEEEKMLERKLIVELINSDPEKFTIQNYSDFSLVYLLTERLSASKYYAFFEHFFIDTSSSTGRQKLSKHINEIQNTRPKYIIREKRDIPWIPKDYIKNEMRFYDLFIRPQNNKNENTTDKHEQ